MIVEILLVVAAYFAYFLYKIKKVQSTHWQKMGVKCPPGGFILGNTPAFNWDILLLRKNVNDVAREQYEMMKGEKIYGGYIVTNPNLTITDPELAKQVLVKDFNFFVDRLGSGAKDFFDGSTKNAEIWKKQMANSPKELWKVTRPAFSPIFTSGKMKAMVPFIREVNETLMKNLEVEAKSGQEFDLKTQFGKFSMDTIASCAFGVDAQSFKDSKSEFVTNARSVFRRDLRDCIVFSLVVIPGMAKMFHLLNVDLFKPKETEFFREIIEATLRQRMKSDIKRNDLVDMMIEAMKEDGEKNIDETTIVATAMIILIAGYDTTAQTLSYAAYELAMNLDIQERLKEEVDEAFDENDGQFPDYTKVQSMEYLDMVFHETLRKYPAIGTLQRAAMEEYTFPGTNITLEKGQEVFINVAGIHADPEYYPNPKQFNPENFSKESKAARHPYAFLGFGNGPRNCIGMRFAMLEAKYALISLVRRYDLHKSPNTPEIITLDPSAVLGAPKDDLMIRITQRDL